MKVFVGSSSEQKELAETVCLWLEESNCEPRIWSSIDVFRPGDMGMTRLKQVTKEVDAAIFIISPDDKIWYRGEELASPRDNVIFEYGLFLASCGDIDERKVIILAINDTKIASDLAGLTVVMYKKDKQTAAQIRVKDWARSLAPSPTPKHQRISRVSRTKRDLFIEGTNIISSAQHHVVLCAKTPILLLGARPYADQDKFKYEQDQYDKYRSIAIKASEGKIRFVVGASLPCVHAIINSGDATFKALVRAQLEEIFLLAARPGSRFEVLWYYGVSPVTFLVADEKSMIWFKGSNQDNIWIHDESDDLSSALRGQLGAGWVKEDREKLLQTLFE